MEPISASEAWPGHDWVDRTNIRYLYRSQHLSGDPFLYQYECRKCGLWIEVRPSQRNVVVKRIVNGHVETLFEGPPETVPDCGPRPLPSAAEASRARAEMLAEIDEIISPWWVGGRADTIRWMARKLTELGVDGETCEQ